MVYEEFLKRTTSDFFKEIEKLKYLKEEEKKKISEDVLAVVQNDFCFSIGTPEEYIREELKKARELNSCREEEYKNKKLNETVYDKLDNIDNHLKELIEILKERK